MKETNILLKIGFLAALMILFGGFARETFAVTYTVDTTSDSSVLTSCTTRPGDCSLRGAIARANSNSNIPTTIDFAIPVSDTFIPTGCTAKGICTITLTGGALTFDPSYYSVPLTITNSIGAGRLIISGNYQSTVFYNRGNLTLNGITITKGYTSNTGNDAAGGIFNSGSGSLTLTNSVVTGNSTADASSGRGGITNYGTMSIRNSTVSNNVNAGGGGGIQHSGVGQLTVRNSTISGNKAGSYGGGIYISQSTNPSQLTSTFIVNSTISGNRAQSGGGIFEYHQISVIGGYYVSLSSVTVTDNTATSSNNFSAGGVVSFRVDGNIQFYKELVGLNNTIVAGNHSPFNPDVWGTINQYSSYNLIGDGTRLVDNSGNFNQIGTAANPINPMLTPLGNYGGATKTHALLSGSPAIDYGSSPNLTTDQRGFARPSGNAADIGAYEVQY